MSAPNNRRRDPGGFSSETILLAALIGLAVAFLILANVGARLGHRLAGTGEQLPADPFAVAIGVLTGSVAWPVQSTVVVAAIILALGLLSIPVVRSLRRSHKQTSRVDRAAVHMGRGRDVESMTTKAATATSQRLGAGTWLGVPIGRLVAGGAPLYASAEDQIVAAAGPRTGKTTSLVVPAILDAPGAALVTSNKRDVVDATRDVRAGVGQVWVFDPQTIALEQPTWWWNPLSYVVDEVKAASLAEHFASGSRAAGARTDAYFDPAGQDLLADMLLAAALDNHPITDVYRWLTRPVDQTPASILAAHGYVLQADRLEGTIALPDKQRGGVYGTAQQMATCLTTRAIARWVTPEGAGDRRPQFDPKAFIETRGTLYSLSKEGRGTAGPLVTALTVAVVEAAEEKAARSAGGRLSTPLLGILDEAANVCRWRNLPDLYSHYGSRGIVLMTVLQSWSQGEEVWGEAGMRKLWSAANVKAYLGGIDEEAFLERMSRIIGDYDRLASSSSYSRGQRSTSQHLSRERLLGVDDLAALPKGRAVVFSSGNRPTLARTIPWMSGPHAAEVRSSITAHDPGAASTLADADRELATVAVALDAIEETR